MYPGQNGFKLEIKNRQKIFKSTYIWKFKTHFQLNHKQKKKSQRKLENSMNKQKQKIKCMRKHYNSA